METSDYPIKPFDTYISYSPSKSQACSTEPNQKVRKNLKMLLAKLEKLPLLLKIKLTLLFKNYFSEKKNHKIFLDETLLAVTRERREMIKFFLESMLLILETDNPQAHRLVGPQGIGKTFSFFLLANFLRVPELNEFIKLVYINDGSLIANEGWLPVLDEFIFTFPESSESISKLKETSNEGDILKAIRQKLYEVNESGKMTVLICDNVNGLKGPLAQNIFDKLKISGWKMKIICETNNNDQETKNNFLTVNYNSFFHMNELKRLLNEFTPMKEPEIGKIQSIVGSNPREAFLLFCQPCTTLEEKIAMYKDKRKTEIMCSYSQYLASRSSKFSAKLFKATFYLDKDVYLSYMPSPEIDKQWMLYQKEKMTYNYKITSLFPFAREVLTEYLESLMFDQKGKEIDKDFYEMRLQELREHVTLIGTDPELRGHFYEEYFFVRMKYSNFLREKLEWYFFPSNYFNKYLKQFGWDVIYTNFNFYFKRILLKLI